MPSGKEAIILAGGLGTRLRDTVPDLPKCMAPVAGRPFLFYVINQLRSQGIERFIFSLGFRSDSILSYLETEFNTLDYTCCVEDQPLGTGGAIQVAAKLCNTDTVGIANGDTLYRADLVKAWELHKELNAECSLLLKPMKAFDRYGVVEIDPQNTITSFREKQFYEQGNINGGLYILNLPAFLSRGFPEKFSFETDYLEKYYEGGKFAGIIDNGYFIDIGIPEDFSRAQAELKKPPLDLHAIDKSWTIFIDRDGVINEEKKEDYILNWNEFKFYNGVKEALARIASRFGKIIVVSNQRGVGKRSMTLEDLQDIHRNMLHEIHAAGGRIDNIYYCTATENKDSCRKPNPGMAFKAKRDDPSIDLGKAIMIGNKLSDMRFARNAGLCSVFLATTNPDTPSPHPDIDLRFNDLLEFANRLG